MPEIFPNRYVLIVLLTILVLLPAYMCSFTISESISSSESLSSRSSEEDNSSGVQFGFKAKHYLRSEHCFPERESTTDERPFFNEMLQKHVYNPNPNEMKNPFMSYFSRCDNLSQIVSAFMGFNCISRETADFIVGSLAHDHPDLWLPPTDVLSLSELKKKIFLTLNTAKELKLEFESIKSVFESVYASFSKDLITKNLKRYSKAMETLKMYRILEAKTIYKLKHIWKPESKAKEKIDLFEHFNPSANMTVRKKYILKNRNIFQHSIRSLYVAKLLGVVACDAMKFNFKSIIRFNLREPKARKNFTLDDLNDLSESFTSINPFEFNYENVKSHEDKLKQLLENYVEIINTEDCNFRDEYYTLEEGIQKDLRMHGTILSTTVTSKHIKHIKYILISLTEVIDSNAYILQRINEDSNYGIKLLPTVKFLDNSKYAPWTIAKYIATIILAIVFRNNFSYEVTEVSYVQTPQYN
ncbi:hypothetical protein NEAUS05_0706 [Nematocida ausubeli]|nr:hypothetical protein NEAUS07_0691 [Nematocida ausubeli]KAI5147399.1 hypothetical protein NEAUS05_0706 [Nematocida ausubeli]